MKRYTVMEAEIKANCYAGQHLDGEAYWEVYYEDDKETSEDKQPIVLELENFPIGTKVIVNIPVCPNCGLSREEKVKFTKGRWKTMGFEKLCQCGFDWHDWILDQYS